MSPWKLFALLALGPSLVSAQAPSASIDAARGAGPAVQAGADRRAQIIDASAAEAPPPEAAPSQGGVNLNRAAAQLEGQAVEEAAPAPAAAAGAPAPDTVTVRPGDTLWGLSGRYLNNPWYWPKVWSYNPAIANPHWIYPGNVVRFFPTTEEGPVRAEPAPALVAQEEAPAAAPRELEDLSKGSIDKIELVGEEDAVAVAGPYKIGQVRGKAAPIRRDSFITRFQLEESGVIQAAFEEKSLLTALDKIYGRFKDPRSVKPGQTYSIYRTLGRVKHPVTGELLGYETQILGRAKVNSVNAQVATLSITASYDPIERGDFLGPWSEQLLRPIVSRPNRAALEGYIVAVSPAIITGAAEFNAVYIDKGKAEGVEEGNTFHVVRAGDPYKQPPDRPLDDKSLPRETIGVVTVFDVKEHASTAFVRRSILELLVGDRVEMRLAGSGGP
jgi:nucleoid-associated protein YgaU